MSEGTILEYTFDHMERTDDETLYIFTHSYLTPLCVKMDCYGNIWSVKDGHMLRGIDTVKFCKFHADEIIFAK